MLYYGYKKDRVLITLDQCSTCRKRAAGQIMRMFILKSNRPQSCHGGGGYFFLLVAIAMIATTAVKAEAKNIPN